MLLPIPWNDAFSQFRLIVRTPIGDRTMTMDDTHRVANVPLPPGVNEEDVEIVGLGLGRNGQPIPGTGSVLIKPARARSAPVAEVEPKIEGKLEPPAESSAESSDLRVSEATAEPIAEPQGEYPRRRRRPAVAATEAEHET